jgi:5-methylcytosine-specific restriction endonuclease McrA
MKHVLMLNKNWMAIATVPLETAVGICCRDHGRVVDTRPDANGDISYAPFLWNDWLAQRSVTLDTKVERESYIRTGSLYIERPEIITLSKYNGHPKRRAAFSRRGLLVRDSRDGRPQCQYCGTLLPHPAVTIDHVTPRAQGGRTAWENCVASCATCNSRKADRTPEQARMPLIKQPRKPAPCEVTFMLANVPRVWLPFIPAGA